MGGVGGTGRRTEIFAFAKDSVGFSAQTIDPTQSKRFAFSSHERTRLCVVPGSCRVCVCTGIMADNESGGGFAAAARKADDSEQRICRLNVGGKVFVTTPQTLR